MEEYANGLRKIRQRHHNLHSMAWSLFCVFLLGTVTSVAFPPLALLSILSCVVLFVLYWRLATSKCPRCEKRFYSLFQIAMGRMRVREAVGSVKCCHCKLSMNELPEAVETPVQSHTDEWRQ